MRGITTFQVNSDALKEVNYNFSPLHAFKDEYTHIVVNNLYQG